MKLDKHDIEVLDRKRMRVMAWYLVGVILFVILSITRYFLRMYELNQEPVGMLILAALILSLIIIIVSTVMSMVYWKAIKDNPILMEALNNELVQSLEVSSWKAAFIAAISVTVFFAVVSFFYPDCDPVLVALTAIVAGAGAYHGSFYFKYKAL